MAHPSISHQPLPPPLSTEHHLSAGTASASRFSVGLPSCTAASTLHVVARSVHISSCSGCLHGFPRHWSKILTVTWGPHGPVRPCPTSPPLFCALPSLTSLHHLGQPPSLTPGLKCAFPLPRSLFPPSLHLITPSHPSYFDVKMTSSGKALSP